jgi:hypothetical protein
MSYYFYINAESQKEGPVDLITMMRRINAQKITPETQVYVGAAPVAVPAHHVEELRGFFNRPVEDVRLELKQQLSFSSVFRNGTQFLGAHQTTAVFAGAVLLLSIMLAQLLNELVGTVLGITAGWLFFCILQGFYLAITVRIYRGQSLSLEFMDRVLGPISFQLIVLGVISALLSAAGALLLIIPGAYIFLWATFASFIAIDRQTSLGTSLSYAKQLIDKMSGSLRLKVLLALVVYVLCAFMMFPLPLIMPIMAGALCSLYEDLASS